MSNSINLWLMLGAALSGVAAGLHVAIIVVGAPWYRLFGAGEKMATMAEAGRWTPALLASTQVTPFLLWSSVICLGYGLVHLVGLMQVWGRL